jgi:hypothetical protein
LHEEFDNHLASGILDHRMIALKVEILTSVYHKHCTVLFHTFLNCLVSIIHLLGNCLPSITCRMTLNLLLVTWLTVRLVH